jgi:peptide-methionine (R)-S-oxide reductase
MRYALILLVLVGFGCNGQVPPSSSKTGTQALEDSKTGEGVVEDRLASLVARPIPPLGSKSSLQDEDYRDVLTPQEFHILRDKGTERAFSGEYNASKTHGVFHCRACNAPLFESSTKFDSRTGWPSFYDAVEGRVSTEDDTSMGITRQEIVCSHCGGHLGHVFEDGPEPTGLRYCVNSLSIVLDQE